MPDVRRVLTGLFVATGLVMLGPAIVNADVALVQNGQAKAVIVAAPAVMQPDDPAVNVDQMKNPAREAEVQRRRLRESVNDLALYLEKMSGAKVEVVTAAPAAGDGRVQILVGAPAAERFGPPEKQAPFKQAFRLVVGPQGVGLAGESDLATSYAVYEVLDRLGCRWFMPSDMGEVIPQSKTISLKEADESLAPATSYRTIWYADEAYKRRNRMGGLTLHAGHALEITGSYLTAEDKKAHPEWIADIDGKKVESRLKWSNKALAEFIADKIVARHAEDPQPSYSLSPDDGANWDNSPEDRALDAEDFDPTFGQNSITDRYLVLVNRIAERVVAKAPDTILGFLAYAQYTRPPVRETVHPSLIPQVAPIVYSRAHPMNMDEVPDNKDLRYVVQGWAKAAKRTSWYFYGFFLAEVSAPHPMLRKWGHDVPYVMRNGNCDFWQPETQPNFEYAMHALYMANRLAWDKNLDPQAIYDEINQKFYGNAASQMAAYWDHIDRCWHDTDEYSGCGFGHMRRFTPERMVKARELMDAALAAARTEPEKFRIGIANDSLKMLEKFMQLRRDLAEGRFATLVADSDAWRAMSNEFGAKYTPQSGFTKSHVVPQTLSITYFDSFYGATYADAARIAAEKQILSAEKPLRNWKYQTDPEKKGLTEGWEKPEVDDSAWKTTDVAAETWSTLGLHGYMKSMWYRTKADVPQVPAGKKTYLWIGSTDGSVKVFVNGKPVKYQKPVVGADGKPTGQFETLDEASGYCQPFNFEITDAVKAGAPNDIAIFATRGFLNELGTGGLLSPAVIYAEK